MSVSLPSIASFHQGAHSVAVVGLGYVGLPLAVAFARHFNVIGFDLNAARVEELLREQLLELAKPLMKTEYGQYLQVIAKEGVL